MRTLRVTSGPLSGHSVEVERDLVIGRQDADLTIPDSELSRRHAVVRPVDTGVIVEDLGSLNGTFVGDERIGGPVTLIADTTIRVGQSVISLELDLAPPPPAATDGRTRLATPVVSAPEPPPEADAGPPVTRVRPVPEALELGDEIAEPGVTRVRPVPPDAAPAPPAEAEAAAEPAAGPPPDVTRVRPVAVPVDPLPPIVPPAVTRVRPVPDLDEPPASAPPPATPPPAAPPAAGPPPGRQAGPPKGFRRLLGRFRRGRP